VNGGYEIYYADLNDKYSSFILIVLEARETYFIIKNNIKKHDLRKGALGNTLDVNNSIKK